MELKAYMEGFQRVWWAGMLIIVLALMGGYVYAENQTSNYTASTSIMLNAPMLASSALPSTIVQLNIPTDYRAYVVMPAELTAINQHYPRISIAALRRAINITTDDANHILLIRVTDSKPGSAVDIANYLAQQFVQMQTANLQRQLAYYQTTLQARIQQLMSEIDQLNAQITQLQPPLARSADAVPISPQARITLNADQYKVNNDVHDLYINQQALKDIQNVLPLFQKAYLIQQPATVADTPVIPPLPLIAVEGIALGVGMCAFIMLVIVWEYFSPSVRHRDEIQRLAHLPVLTGSSPVSDFKLKSLQKSLLNGQSRLLQSKLAALRLLCGSLGVPALKTGGHTIFLTSPREKRFFATVLATLLAHNGHRTLLIDADFERPTTQEQVALAEPANLTTPGGVPLPFIYTTKFSRLFVLPATQPQEARLSCTRLLELLPELQRLFPLIIIDGPPLDHADAHLLAVKAQQTLLLIQKRRDSLKALKMAARQCQDLQLNVQGLLVV